MRRLARAYQARLNFYVINRGELPDYEGTAPAVGRPVVGAVSALRAKQPMDFTFDAHSELSPEKLKEWIDLFLAGKLKKVRRGASCANAVLRASHALRCRSARRAHRWRSCRTAPPCASTTRSGRYTSTTWPSGTRRSATWSSPCSKCVAGHNSLVVFALLSPARSRRQLEEALLLDPASPILHYNMGQVDPPPPPRTHTPLTTHTLSMACCRHPNRSAGARDDGRDGGRHCRVQAVARQRHPVHGRYAHTEPLRYGCELNSVPLIVHPPAAYHSLARAISVLGDAESAVNILQVRD